MSKARIINWNIERRRPSSWQGVSLREEIESLSPDLVCITEGWTTSLGGPPGHNISAPGVAWSPQDSDERKVLLWSKQPWRDGRVVPDLEETGSAVTGLTIIAGLEVRVVGLCIPYHFASPLGQKPKAKMWSQHTEFLKKLKPLLAAWIDEGPLIVTGDFNRRVPKSWGPLASYKLLEEAFECLDIITAGNIDRIGEQAIDHIAVVGPFAPISILGLPAEDDRGRKRSDHFGVMADIDIG